MKKLTAVLLCAALCLSGCGSDNAIEYEVSSESVSDVEELPVPETSETAVEGNIFIYICGAVNAPGVYELPSGSRVFEAVEAAGGLSAEADTRSLNQAELLTDGEQITVYTVWEVSASGAAGEPGVNEDDGLVNINTADVSELMTLPGIGEARAGAIIAYRERHGAFETAQDICNVTGIKEKLYARIENLIKV